LSLLVFNRPPYYSLHHGRPDGGFLLTTALAAFQWADIPVAVREMPPGRIIATLKAPGERACAVGWYKTPEREAFGRFSLPIYRNQPLVVAMAQTLALPDTRSPFLADLLAAGWRWGLREGFSYGPDFDQTLAAYPAIRRFADSGHMVELLAQGRLDAMLIEPEELAWILKNTPRLGQSIRVVRLADAPAGGQRHILCSAAVSKEEMARLDAAIETFTATEEYQGLAAGIQLQDVLPGP
jgi:polar amino acid transport system substrate-binding protein